MRIDHLVIQNYCCFESFELKLNPQFNLLVGDNASGKTSLLDAIHIAAGSWLLGVDVPRRSPAIEDGDVRLLAFKQNSRKYTFEKQYPVSIRASGVVMGEQVVWVREKVSDRSTTRYGGAEAIMNIGRNAVASLRSGEEVVLPLISSYGTERLWIEPDRVRRNGPASSVLTGDRPTRLLGYRYIQFLIHEEALFDWLAKETFAALQDGSRSPALRVVTQAIVGCIDDAEDLYYDIRREDVVVTFKHHGTHPYSHLSDGQRAMLALVGDIAKKAIQLNSYLNENVLEETPGIVTIDELDLHLHPKWQRRVIQDLKRTFPKIQFIATTHSPQLIGEAEPHEIIRLGGQDSQSTAQSFGMDSNWILTHVMSANKRDKGIERKFEKVEELISSLKLDEAKVVVNQIRNEIRGNHPELVRLSARIDRLAGKAK